MASFMAWFLNLGGSTYLKQFQGWRPPVAQDYHCGTFHPCPVFRGHNGAPFQLQPMIRNTADTWGGIARLFHWLMAMLILVQVVLGWVAVSLRLSPLKLNLFVWHKSIGIVILALALARILWRVTNVTPGLPEGTPAWERHAARWNHVLLYLVLIVMPITGWIVNSAAGIPFRI